MRCNPPPMPTRHPPAPGIFLPFPRCTPMLSKNPGSAKDLPVDASRTGEAPPLGSEEDLPVDASRTGEALPLGSKKTRVE